METAENNVKQVHEKSTGRAWLKFAAGICIISALASFFGSGYTPPGIFGEVLRHNQQADIDASPLFYTEVENMAELIAGAEKLRAEAALRQAVHGAQVRETEKLREER